MEFSHKGIEQKWQKFWEENNTFVTTNKSNKKAYILDMFPYPSGAGLHVGHPKGYTATDVFSRMRKLQGYDVLHPIGWDAFGLPAEQYAIQTGNDPAEFTAKNIDNFRHQLKALGFSYDYAKEINTSTPQYFKITQWIFEQLYQNGLAEMKDVDVNWCSELGTVLANEEVLNVNGKMVSERGHFPVTKKPMRQWILKITNYAEKLLDSLDDLDWPQSVKELQRNWIGKSIGCEIKFSVQNYEKIIDVFTTRADTMYGIEYLVLAPEHPYVLELTTSEYQKDVKNFIELVKTKNELDRQDTSKEKIGLFIGSYAINPINNKIIPIWISDYVLPFYGTGAVMAVPGHDERDYLFAKKYQLPISYIIEDVTKGVWTKDGKHINSGQLDGLNIEQATNKIIEILISNNLGTKKITYKLRDWLFSRQRYWGEPFPIIHWEDGSITLIDENELPLLLPKMADIKPSQTGESPLANATDWVIVTDANGKKGRRETNTMPQWAGSCWYYLGYLLKQENGTMLDLKSPEAYKIFQKWLPVDLYIGGQEHAVLHLLYARFWHKFLYDQKIVPTPEPFLKLVNQGMILGENGLKMSKSKGNVINPNDIIRSHGADALRIYEMFMGPIEASLTWNTNGLDSARKWLDRVYRIYKNRNFVKINNGKLDYEYHSMIQKVTEMIEKLNFNTAISQLMIFINACYRETEPIYKPYFEGFLILLSCFAPHLSEELWQNLDHNESITYEEWPIVDEKYLVVKNITVAVQINGKLKLTLDVPNDMFPNELLLLVKTNTYIQSFLEGKKILKEIIVKNKIVNFVI